MTTENFLKIKKIILDALSDGEYLSILKEYGLPVTQKGVDALFLKVEMAESQNDLHAIDNRILNFILSELFFSQIKIK